MKFLEGLPLADTRTNTPTRYNEGGASSYLNELAQQQRRDLRDTYRQQTRASISKTISVLRAARQEGYLDEKDYEALMKIIVGAKVGYEIANIVEDFFD